MEENSQIWYQMNVSGYLHLRTEPQLANSLGTVWTLQPVQTQWSREKPASRAQ